MFIYMVWHGLACSLIVFVDQDFSVCTGEKKISVSLFIVVLIRTEAVVNIFWHCG